MAQVGKSKKTVRTKARAADTDDTKYLCPFCMRELPKKDYYVSSDTNIRTGIVRMCKECANQWVLDEEGHVSKERMKIVLEYIDKPFLSKLYDSTYYEVNNPESGRFGENLFGVYLKNLNSLKQYKGYRWHDSDILTAAVIQDADKQVDETADKTRNEEILEMYKQNRHDVIKVLGYDPFEHDAEEDKPLLYSKLCGYFDETNEDEFLIASAVEVVKLQNQVEKINNAISKYQSDTTSIVQNAPAIKTLMGIKQNASNTALALAKDNGFSQNFNKKKTKGSTTWSGRVKELKEMNLREQEINAFDVGTAAGMQQVAIASMNAILGEINLDENDYTEMIATQRKELVDLQGKCEAALEEARILKRENNDLKDFLRSKGLIDEHNRVIDFV